jgi:hypothetical protein
MPAARDALADYALYRFGDKSIVVVREKGTSGEEFAAALRDRDFATASPEPARPAPPGRW